MADDPKVEVLDGKEVDEDEQALHAELEEDGELLDDSGKPLPWNHPKRVRQLYKEAKEGRRAANAFKELGIKPSDVGRLKADLGRLDQFDAAYAEYQQRQKAGDTSTDEDAEAAKAKANANVLRRQLRSLGVKFDEPEDPQKEQAVALETKRREIVSKSFEAITQLAEAAGFDLDSMSKADREDLIEEIDFKVGKKISRNPEARDEILGGSLRPVKKFIQEVLETLKPEAKATPKGTGIKNLPPRGHSSIGSKGPQAKVQPEPKTVKDATAQMVEDLRKANKQRRTEGE